MQKQSRKRGGKLAVGMIQKFIESSYHQNPPDEINGYKLDKQLSTMYTTVYWNPETQQGIIANRPTYDLRDVLSEFEF